MALATIFGEYTESGTRDAVNKHVIDSVLNENVITSRFMKNSKSFRGIQERFSIRVGIDNASAANGGGFTGLDTFNTSIQNETQQIRFNPKQVYEGLNLAYSDFEGNTGKEQIYSILGRETEYALTNLFDNVGTMLYSTNGETSKEFSGLRHIVTDTGSYGGLSRTTYTVLKPGDTSGTGYDTTTTETTLSALNTVITALTSGSIKPTIAMTSPEIFDYIEALLEPTKRYDIGGYTQVTRDGMSASQGALGAATGLDAIVVKGVPIVRDEKCPAGHIFFMNEKTLNFYKRNFGTGFGWTPTSYTPSVVMGQYSENMPKGAPVGITYSGLKEPTNQAAAISQFVMSGEFICTDPRRQGGFTALTS